MLMATVLANKGIKALCCNWYIKIGVSDLPVGPTVSRVAAYLTAMLKQALAPPIDMDAMQILPLKS